MNNFIKWEPLSEIPSVSKKLLKLGIPTCPTNTQLAQGTSRPISMKPSGGTAPYTVNWKVDNILSGTWKNIAEGQIISLNWPYNESIGTHIYTTEVIDSCPFGSMSDSTSCTLQIVQGTTQPPTTQPPTTQPPSQCIGCDLTTNICIANNCIPKNYIIYGGIGLAILLLMR